MAVPIADHDEIAERQVRIFPQCGLDGSEADIDEESDEVGIFRFFQIQRGQGLNLGAQVFINFYSHMAFVAKT